MQMHLLTDRPAPETTNAQATPTNNATLINQDSGNFEYYTPLFIVEAARFVLGVLPTGTPDNSARMKHLTI